MRRRLFWVTYKLDRLLSQSLGRPPSIPDGFINVPMPSNLHDVDIHPNHYGPLEGESCSYKAVFIHTTRLRQLQSEILNNTYGTINTSPPAEEWFDEMFERLKEWLATSPDPRGAVSTEGYAISFHSELHLTVDLIDETSKNLTCQIPLCCFIVHRLVVLDRDVRL